MDSPTPRPSVFSQFRECVSKEILAGILSHRYTLVLILTVVAALSVTVVRTHVYRNQVRQYHEGSQAWRRTMGSVSFAWQSTGLGLSFEKAPEPLAIFAFGLENELTRSVNFCEYYPDRAGLRKLGATSFRYFSQIDITGVIFFGYSLLALMLVFDAVSAGRERGTIRILLAGPIRRTTVILSKIFAGLVTLAIPLCLAWGLSIGYAMAVSGHVFTGGELARLGCMVAVSLVYVGAIFALGLAASCRANSSNSSLMLVLFGWLLLVLFLPAGAKAICDIVYPIPSFASVEEDTQATQAAVFDDRLTTQIADEILREQPDVSPERMQELIQKRIADRARNAERDRENKMRSNVALFGKLLRVSPAWSYLSVSTSLAGTGAADYLKFLDDVRLFRSEFEAASEEQKRVADASIHHPHAFYGEGTPFSPDRWPSFRYARAPVTRLVDAVSVDCAWIVGAMFLFLLIAVVGFVRAEV